MNSFAQNAFSSSGGVGGALKADLAAALTTVAYVGDSIMAWTSNGNSVDEELFDISHGEITGSNYGVASYGMNLISGTMTDNALATSPKILIVEGGVNDIIAGAVFADWDDKYDLILTKCKAAGTLMMVEEIWPARGFADMNGTKATNLIAWNAALAAWVAANTGVELIEIYDAMEDPSNPTYLNPLYTSDGIHPNPSSGNAGVEKHAQILQAKLKDATLAANTFTGLQQFSGTTHAGLRLNNLTTTERDAIASPQAGMVIWNTTAARLQLHNGSTWTAGMVRLDGDTMMGALTISVAGANSVAPLMLTGALNTGGSGTTTFPHIFHQPTGTTAATTWSSGANKGTVFGANEATGFTGDFLAFAVAGTMFSRLNNNGDLFINNSIQFSATTLNSIALSKSGNGILVATAGAFGPKFDSLDLRFPSTWAVAWTNGTGFGGTADTFLYRKTNAAATLQMGADAAGVTNQMFTAASRITSDGVGADLTIAAGNGRGGAGGTLILSTYTTAGAATIGTLTSRMTFDTNGAIAFPNVTAVTTESVVSDRTLAVTINGTAYKFCLKA